MTKDEFEHWKHWGVTQEILRHGKERVTGWDEMLHELMNGCTSQELIGLQGARLQGMITGMNTILEIDWEDLQDDHSAGTQASD